MQIKMPTKRNMVAKVGKHVVSFSDTDTLFTKSEVLDLLKISHVSLYFWIRQGKFPNGIAIGDGKHGSIRWIKREVYDWIANRPIRIPKGGVAA
jgi:predicted DNA-binding transcriptional regulator AlpA